MQLGLTLFLAGSVSLLVTLQSYSAIEIEALIAGNLERVGVWLLVLAILAMWQREIVQRVAFYVAVVGAAYLLLQHGADIAAIMKGFGV